MGDVAFTGLASVILVAEVVDHTLLLPVQSVRFTVAAVRSRYPGTERRSRTSPLKNGPRDVVRADSDT